MKYPVLVDNLTRLFNAMRQQQYSVSQKLDHL